MKVRLKYSFYSPKSKITNVLVYSDICFLNWYYNFDLKEHKYFSALRAHYIEDITNQVNQLIQGL